MDKINELVKSYVVSTYGNLIQYDDPIYDEKNNVWNVNLKSLYPRIIVDDCDIPVRELYFITLSSIGKIQINDKYEVINNTSRKNIINNINNNMNIWNDKLERIIIKSSSSNLVFTPTVQHFFNPLRRILSTILLTGKMSTDEIMAFPKSDRAYEWLYLLERSEIVKKTNRGYEYDSMWSLLYDESNDITKYFIKKIESTIFLPKNKDVLFINSIMSYILQEYFGYIKSVMKIKGINRIINVNSVYYRPCLNSEKILKFKPSTLLYQYNKLYPNLKLSLISSTITELFSVGLLNHKDGLIEGSEIHLNEMLKMEPSKQIVLPIA